MQPASAVAADALAAARSLAGDALLCDAALHPARPRRRRGGQGDQ
jgi:hypothetical protein